MELPLTKESRVDLCKWKLMEAQQTEMERRCRELERNERTNNISLLC